MIWQEMKAGTTGTSKASMPAAQRALGILNLLVPILVLSLLALSILFDPSSRSFQLACLGATLMAVGQPARRLADWILPNASVPSRWSATWVVASALIVTPATVLGHLGWLWPEAMLGWAAFVYAGMLWIEGRRGGSRRKVDDHRHDPQDWVEAVATATLMAALLLALYVVHHHRYLPPGAFNYDDTSYHLTAVATWLHTGDLRVPKLPVGDVGTAFYPLGSELFAWFLLAPFRDSDVAARWAQLPFAAFSLAALAGITRTLGLSRLCALVAMLLYWSIPQAFPRLGLSAGNDHMAAFFTLAAIDGTLLFSRRPDIWKALYVGLALGLLAGTKYLGLLFAVPILCLLACGGWERRRCAQSAPGESSANALGFRRVVSMGAVIGVTAILAGGYTYLRNAVATGNPLFPAPIEIAGMEIFPGWSQASLAYRRSLEPEPFRPRMFLWSRTDIFGFLFRWTLLPVGVLAPVAVVLRRGLVRRAEWMCLSILPAVYFLVFVYVLHDHRDLRYFLPGLGVAAVLLAWLSEEFGRRARRAAQAGLCLAAFVAMGTPWFGVWPTVALSFGAVVAVVGLRHWHSVRPGGSPTVSLQALLSPGHRVPFRMGAVLFLVWLAAAPILGRTVEKYQDRRLRGDPAAEALEQLTQGRGVTVAYSGWNQPYLFFGRSLQNHVVMVPTRRGPWAAYFSWRGSPEVAYGHGRFWRWWGNLEKMGVDAVVVVRSSEALPELRWMNNRPDLFQLIHRNARTDIWWVHKPDRDPAEDSAHHSDKSP